MKALHCFGMVLLGLVVPSVAIAEELTPNPSHKQSPTSVPQLVLVTQTKAGIDQYVDVASIKIQGETTTYAVYTRFNTNEVQGLALVKAHLVGNCETGEVSTQGVVAYDYNRKEIINRSFPPNKLVTQVSPDSAEASALILACSYQTHRPAQSRN
ncbi:hypothetical protein TUMEXPCC7403_12880 [Tumidithrix helvetica PCC 7403]|uniref:surface-adhesin E family protein n=1 Tax=Tumidithrix helvetica TaxID=3457545 RepID=UPI003C9ADAF1